MENKLKKSDKFIGTLSLITDIRKRLDKELVNGLGITFHHFYILRLCLLSPRSQKELAQNLSLTEASISGLVARLADLSLIEQKPDLTDRRKTSIFLTADGKNKIKIANLLIETELAEILPALSSEAEDLVNYLNQ